MKNKDIYDGALRILAERTDEGANEDYEERAPYIIAAFCCEASELDERYRRANSLPEGERGNEVYVELTANFSCCSRFSTAACIYLAAMLVMDTDPELSDRLYDKYSDIMSAISSEIPAVIEKITDRYGY
ncbi:MAG: hypothetical protein E7641_05065 [Ruminococcaceae bacterium]|nr:hypothetical protein [Oscillospiraceae bacterium]